VRSFLIDGEAVACDGDGMPVFDRLRYRRQDGAVFLFAFDLLELEGRDLRREPRTYRDRKAFAIEAPEHLKRKRA
jgi:ATP-dependent DNA ligase